MIGYSLSLCVRDILMGKVNEEDVDYIITSTRFTNSEEFEELMKIYSTTFWRNDPDKGVGIGSRLLSQNKILQSRIKNSSDCQNINDSWWS